MEQTISCVVRLSIEKIDCKAKTVTVRAELVSPEGEVVYVFADEHHHTETWVLDEGDSMNIKDLIAKILLTRL